MGVALERTIDLAQRLASDEVRLLQLDAYDRVNDAMLGGVWIGFGVLSLVIAWVVACAALVVAVGDWMSLEARLGLLAIVQLAFGSALVRLGLRRRPGA